MQQFLWWIGLYNVVGVLVLAAMHSERFADTVLRRATEIVAVPYTHGEFGRLWLWWATSANLFLGSVMMLSTRWGHQAQREVTLAAVAVYAVMYLVMIFGGKKPKYGNGIYVTHGLWIAQITWGLWAYWKN